MWPSMRQCWRVVCGKKSTIICSDGLSDPFEDESEPNVGYGLEILGETTDLIGDQLPASWLFQMVYAVSQQAAAHAGFRELIDDLGTFSMELRAPRSLQAIAGGAGTYGVLLGLLSPDWPAECELPAGGIKYVTVKLLLQSELDYAVNEDEAGRAVLRDRFADSGSFHRSSLSRRAVV